MLVVIDLAMATPPAASKAAAGTARTRRLPQRCLVSLITHGSFQVRGAQPHDRIASWLRRRPWFGAQRQQHRPAGALVEVEIRQKVAQPRQGVAHAETR